MRASELIAHMVASMHSPFARDRKARSYEERGIARAFSDQVTSVELVSKKISRAVLIRNSKGLW